MGTIQNCMVNEPVLVGIGAKDLERLEKLIGRQVLSFCYVPETDVAMMSLDAETHIYFSVRKDRLIIEIECPAWH